MSSPQLLPVGERLTDTKYVQTLFEPINLGVLAFALGVVLVSKLLHALPLWRAAAKQRAERRDKQAERLEKRAQRLQARASRATAASGDDASGDGGAADDAASQATRLRAQMSHASSVAGNAYQIVPEAPAFPAPMPDPEGGRGTAAPAADVGVPLKAKKSWHLLRMAVTLGGGGANAAPSNVAERVSFTGMSLGMCLAMTGPRTPWNPGEGTNDQIASFISMLMWSGMGIVMMFIARFLNDRVLLYSVHNTTEMLRGNVAVAVVEAAQYVASGMIVRAALSGEGNEDDIGTDIAITWIDWSVAQVALLLAVMLVQCLTKYDDQVAIRDHNAAAGIKFAGTIVAMGFITSHPFTLSDSMVTFGVFVGLAVVLQTVVRQLVDRVMLPWARTDDEIERDRNWGVALIEASVNVSVASMCSSFLAAVDGGCALRVAVE